MKNRTCVTAIFEPKRSPPHTYVLPNIAEQKDKNRKCNENGKKLKCGRCSRIINAKLHRIEIWRSNIFHGTLPKYSNLTVHLHGISWRISYPMF